MTHINESAENYLETILILSKKLPVVRAVDISEELGCKKSSVSVAMKKLRENGYVELDQEGFLLLTQTGREIAARVYDRHRVLTDFFVSLGVSPEVAVRDACKVEHDLSQETFEKLQAAARRNQ